MRRQLMESPAFGLAWVATAAACACFATQVILLGLRDSWEAWGGSFFVWFCALPIAAILAVVSFVFAGNRRPLLVFGLASLLFVIAVWSATVANMPIG